MGQQTLHTTYVCPCGAGRVVLTTTAFGGAGARKLHTEVVQCTVCKGRFAFSLEQVEAGASQAIAQDVETRARHVLSPLPPG